jgi:hypothetical protein
MKAASMNIVVKKDESGFSIITVIPSSPDTCR